MNSKPASLIFRIVATTALCVFCSSPGSAQVVRAAQQQQAAEKDWATVQSILGPIHGVSTTPPEKLITPKYTSGALMGNGDIGVVAGDTSTSRQTFHFGKSDFWGTHWNNGHHAPEVSILSFGSMTLSSPAATSQTSGEQSSSSPGGSGVYRMDQDILHAEVTTTLEMGGRTVHLRSWTADGENVFVTEMRADAGAGGDLPIAVKLAMPLPDASGHMIFPASSGSSKGTLWVARENDLTKSTDYKARGAVAVRLLGSSFSNIQPSVSSVDAVFHLKGNAPVWIVAAFQSDARIGLSGPGRAELAQRASAEADHISRAKLSQLQREHLAWWKNFWLRSFIQVHDQTLENYYYGALYVLGSASRPGKLPPSLWGNFITTDEAAWGGRYFMNYNEEAPFYGVFSSNHPELAEPYNRMVLAQVPWQTNRTAEAGYRGVSYQRTFSPFTVIATPPAPIPVAATKNYEKLPSDQKSNATFSFLPSIQYYEYTQDKQFLRAQLYPAMKKLDAFWRDFAVRDASGKRWMFEHSSAHEGGDDVDPNLDLGFAHRVERELIATSAVLGVDAGMRPVWQSFNDELDPYPQGTVNGKRVFYIAASVKNKIKNQGLFEPGDQPINLEGLVYPGENLAIGGDPEQLRIARNSMEEMNSWGVTRGGNQNNGFCKIFPVAARIGWPADDLIAKFKAAILHQWRPSNLTVFQGGGGIETSGSVEALDSMLLQHEDGVLRVFPDWPASMDASFTRLRAKGAFLVSSEQRHGQVPWIEIVSEVGGPLTVQSPWGDLPVRLNGRPTGSSASSGGRITLNTARGGHYRLAPEAK